MSRDGGGINISSDVDVAVGGTAPVERVLTAVAPWGKRGRPLRMRRCGVAEGASAGAAAIPPASCDSMSPEPDAVA